MNQQTTTATATSFTFSDAAIKTYPMPATGSVRISDTACRGLALRITAKGVRTFTVRHQRSGKRTLTAIGTYPELSIAEARIKATEMITGETAGASPADGRRHLRDQLLAPSGARGSPLHRPPFSWSVQPADQDSSSATCRCRR